MSHFLPSYLQLLESGELEKRASIAEEILSECNACPHECLTDRKKSSSGFCLSGYNPIVSSNTVHFGEEPGLSGTRGAGNIFFGNCNLRCVFCQNYEISQNWKEEKKHEISVEKLASIMLELQEKGCHNIGLVSPTHFAPQILKAIYIAAAKGLRLPVIYNSNGYDSVDTLKLFDGIIDIYLPDFKYGSDPEALQYSKAPDYFSTASRAIKEMFRQVGDRLLYLDNVIVRGLIIRHLILPNGLAESEEVFKFIAGELSRDVHISLMSQYFPSFKAHSEILLSRKISSSEYSKAVSLMEKYGLHNGWTQEMESSELYRPYFVDSRLDPFRNNRDSTIL
jgi:putative pyruvate formate lyase activating enzyme